MTQFTTVILSLEQLIIVYDCMTDRIIDWTAEVKRREKAGDTIGGLPSNLNKLEDARNEVATVLAVHGIQRRGFTSRK